jgi:hypothetical protein
MVVVSTKIQCNCRPFEPALVPYRKLADDLLWKGVISIGAAAAIYIVIDLLSK